MADMSQAGRNDRAHVPAADNPDPFRHLSIIAYLGPGADRQVGRDDWRPPRRFVTHRAGAEEKWEASAGPVLPSAIRAPMAHFSPSLAGGALARRRGPPGPARPVRPCSPSVVAPLYWCRRRSTGAATRSGYGFVRAAQAAGILHGPWAHVLGWALLAVPVLAGSSGAAAVLRAARASVVFCGLAGLVTLAFSAWLFVKFHSDVPPRALGRCGPGHRGRGDRCSLRQTRECSSCPMNPVGRLASNYRRCHPVRPAASVRPTARVRAPRPRGPEPRRPKPGCPRYLSCPEAAVLPLAPRALGDGSSSPLPPPWPWWERGRAPRWPCRAAAPAGPAPPAGGRQRPVHRPGQQRRHRHARRRGPGRARRHRAGPGGHLRPVQAARDTLPDADLGDLTGLSAQYTGFTTSTDQLTPGVAAVTVTGGSVTGSVDPSQLPLATYFKDLLGRRPQRHSRTRRRRRRPARWCSAPKRSAVAGT